MEQDEDEQDEVLELSYENVYDRLGQLLPNSDWFERLKYMETWKK